MPVIAVLIGAAWPKNDASGPVQSVRAIAELLKDRFRFEFFARSGAPGEKALAAHGQRVAAAWGGVTYCDVGVGGARDLAKLLRSLQPDVLWLNSMWDREFTLPALIGRGMGRIPRGPAILSTRGEFSAGALALNAGRKRIMRRLLRGSGLLGGVTLHTTGPAETRDVRAHFPQASIAEIGNARHLEPMPRHDEGVDDTLRLLFLGRISPVKGLHNALGAMHKVDLPARLTIHGPVHDPDYWAMCENMIADLPANIEVDVAGPVSNADVSRIYAAHDLFLNPSASENFGHTIFESLQAGTPVLTGLHTPWNKLEADRAGFNVPSDDIPELANAITNFGQTSRSDWRQAARKRAERFIANQTAPTEWKAWFERVIPPHDNGKG